MNGKDCLLGTNIVIGLFANESSITEKIKPFPGSIFIPSIVLGELFYGAEQSTRKDENRKKIEELAEASLVLECDLDSARSYGKIKSQLKIKSSPIPENDIWIAALADQHQLILVTRDSTSTASGLYPSKPGKSFHPNSNTHFLAKFDMTVSKV